MDDAPEIPDQPQRDHILRAVVLGLTLGSYALIPFHPHLSCEGSQRNGAWAGLLFLAVFALEFFRDSRARGRFTPSLLAFVALNLHSGFSH